MSAATERADEVVWHDVECGGYGEDLGLWEALAEKAEGPVLDLGSGTGRVAMHLARRGREVHAVDREPAFIEELLRRAAAEGLDIGTTVADVRDLPRIGRPSALAIASMQLLQLVGDHDDRRAVLAGVAGAIRPGGLVAAAIVEESEEVIGSAGPDVVPDVREADGWLYSSLPIEVADRRGHLEVLRLRQVVSPDGDLSDSEHVDRLSILDARTLEREAAAVGLEPAGRRPVEQSEMHVGSTVVLLRREC